MSRRSSLNGVVVVFLLLDILGGLGMALIGQMLLEQQAIAIAGMVLAVAGLVVLALFITLEMRKR